MLEMNPGIEARERRIAELEQQVRQQQAVIDAQREVFEKQQEVIDAQREVIRVRSALIDALKANVSEKADVIRLLARKSA